MNRPLRWAGIVAVLALTSTGCSTGGSTTTTSVPAAVTASPTGTSSADPSSTATSTSAQEPAAPAPLTRAQVVAALPPPADFGAAWRDATSSRSMTSVKDTITPAACRPLYDQLAGDPLVPLVATAKRDYRPSDGGPFVTVVVRSYPQASAESFTDVAEALGSCPTFTSTTTAGRTTSYRVTPLSFPDLGDRALAFQLEATSGTFSITLQVALTTSASTEVSVVNASIGTVPRPSMTLTAMTRTLARLPR